MGFNANERAAADPDPDGAGVADGRPADGAAVVDDAGADTGGVSVKTAAAGCDGCVSCFGVSDAAAAAPPRAGAPRLVRGGIAGCVRERRVRVDG